MNMRAALFPLACATLIAAAAPPQTSAVSPASVKSQFENDPVNGELFRAMRDKLYVQAASLLAQKVPADWPAVEAEARKALAIDAENAQANYVVGIARANAHDKVGAVPYLQKAQANAGGDAGLKSDADAALKKLGAQ